MKAEHLVLLLCATAAVAPAAAQATATPDSAIAAAGRAAQRWFALLADRNYGASWEQSSAYFREHVSREQWRVNAERLDRQFQRADHRKLVEARWLHDEPPLPRAEYVVLRWLTDLGEGRQVGERVIMTHEQDGAWRPATYDLFPNVEGLPFLVPGRHPPPVPPPPPPRNIVPPGGAA
ncbi:MAG: DUF4019 domain-containing protein [Gemmatimonadales bacterium]